MNNKQTPNLFAGFKCLLFAISALILGSSVKCVDAYHAMHIVLM